MKLMKPHHEAENYFLDFIFFKGTQGHKTRASFWLFFKPNFVLTNVKICTIGYLSQKLEIQKIIFETDTINSLLAYMKCQNITSQQYKCICHRNPQLGMKISELWFS